MTVIITGSDLALLASTACLLQQPLLVNLHAAAMSSWTSLWCMQRTGLIAACVSACGSATATLVTWVLYQLQRCGVPRQWLTNASGDIRQQDPAPADAAAAAPPTDSQHISNSRSHDTEAEAAAAAAAVAEPASCASAAAEGGSAWAGAQTLHSSPACHAMPAAHAAYQGTYCMRIAYVLCLE